MRLDEFDFHLPPELIAQRPPAERGDGRLLVVDRKRPGEFRDTTFATLPRRLRSGDALVINNSQVVPARLLAQRTTGAEIEILFIRRTEGERFVGWVRNRKKLNDGERLQLPDGDEVTYISAVDERIAELEATNIDALLDRHGHMPLPPYIERADEPADHERYQTVYARHPGSVAAPTAGLHFTRGLLNQLADMGVQILEVTLHVGPGTFSPLEHDNVEDNRLHSEVFSISAGDLARLGAARSERRVVAVGTTVARALESVEAAGWLGREPRDYTGETSLFIYPGYRFRVVDALITNFHLPKSSLLLLVSAFLGGPETLAAYQHAIENRYRFFSYGDAMFIS